MRKAYCPFSHDADYRRLGLDMGGTASPLKFQQNKMLMLCEKNLELANFKETSLVSLHNHYYPVSFGMYEFTGNLRNNHIPRKLAFFLSITIITL